MIQWSVFRSLRLVIRWILVQSGFDRSLIWKWICSKRMPQIRNPDPDSPKGTHPKCVLFTWIQVNSVALEDFGFSNSFGKMYCTRYLDGMHTEDVPSYVEWSFTKADQFLCKRWQPEAIFLFGILLIRDPTFKARHFPSFLRLFSSRTWPKISKIRFLSSLRKLLLWIIGYVGDREPDC